MILGQILPFILLGGIAGAVHFVVIARDARLLTEGGSLLVASGLRLGRMLLTVVVLAIAAGQGWPMLLAATAGFMTARLVVLRRLGRVA